MQVSAKELAHLLQGTIVGNPDKIVSHVAKIEEAKSDSLSFIANPKYEHFASETNAGILLVKKDFSIEAKEGITLIKVDDPYSSLAILLSHFTKSQKQKEGIENPSFIGTDSKHGTALYLGAFAYIGNNVTIGDNVKIYPNSYIGDGCTIGDNTTIFAGVKVYHQCVIGNDTIIHSGSVIGSDGFGFAPQADGSFKKVAQTGNVVIGNNVEIGANTVLDRGTLGSTSIKDGVKLDNLVQIAHNVEIGDNTVIAAQAGVSGSTKLGKQCMVGGQAGFVGHINIADGTKVNAQSGVTKSVKEKGSAIAGAPAGGYRDFYKNHAMVKRIPELLDKINTLEQKLNNCCNE